MTAKSAWYPEYARLFEVGKIEEAIAFAQLHLPQFQPDVAYMPVPRCETCRHWDKTSATAGKNVNTCMRPRTDNVDSLMWAEMYDHIITTADFGCVQWEAK